jgi:hypothetical protein
MKPTVEYLLQSATWFFLGAATVDLSSGTGFLTAACLCVACKLGLNLYWKEED